MVSDRLQAAVGTGRRRWLVGLVAIVAAAWIVSAYWPRPKAEPKVLAMGWRPIISQSGVGNAQTESFNIDTGQWRIKWMAESEDGQGSTEGKFRVDVHSSVSGRFMSVAVDQQGAGDGIAYVAEEPRPFFLSIESRGLAWTVQVEEGILGERE